MKIKTFYRTTNSLFTYIKDSLNASWFDDSKVKYLNLYYFLGHSGNKTLSPFMSNIIDESCCIDDEERLACKYYEIPVLSDTSLDNSLKVLANIIVDTYGTKWIDSYDALTLKYDLERESTLTKTETPNITKTSDSKGESNVSSNDTEASYQGFNSTEFTPREKTSNTGNSSNANTITSTEKGNREITEERKGGDISSKVRRFLTLRESLINDIIVKDIDKLLANPYYDYDN